MKKFDKLEIPGRSGVIPSTLRATGISLLASAVMLVSNPAEAQKYLVTSNWFVTTNVVTTTNHIRNGDNNRGLAYGSTSNLVFVADKGTPAIDVLDGTTGNYVGSAVTTGVSGGTFLLDQVQVADDGSTLYSANLTTSINTSAYKLYQWTNWTTAPTVVFNGDPAGGLFPGKRMGDNMAITGSGTNTTILVPVQTSTTATTNFVLFTTTNGSTFTPTVITVTNMAAPSSGNNGPSIALAFYTNNTFLFKQNGGTLFEIQYPSNFASLSSPVAATVIESNTTFAASGNTGQTTLTFAPTANLLAAIGPIPNSAPSTTPFNLYLANPLSGASSSVGSSNSLHFAGNGNFVGGIALGGAGKTNALYTLDCNNGVHGWGLTFVPAAVAPIISSYPSGGTVYTNLNTFTFAATASGSTPLYYYWQYNTVSNLSTASTIFVGTNLGTFTLSNLSVANSGWYNVIVSNVAGTTNSGAVQLTVQASLTSPYVSNLWSLAADNSQIYLDTGYNTRGLAYDPNTSTLLLAEHSQASITALNPSNGAYMYTLTTPSTGLPSGSIFPLGQIGVSDDGVLYACNVSSYNPTNSTASSGPPSTDFSITRFSNISDPNGTNPYSLAPAFTGDPGAYSPGNPGVSSGDRWGDSMAVRGAGTNTQILLGSYVTLSGGLFGTGPGTNVAILTTTDGITFTPTTIAVTNAPDGFSYLGVAWGAGNTFWTKSPGYNLRQVQYDLTTGIGTVIQSFATTATAGSLNNLDGIGLDISNNILAGVQTSDTPNDLQLFQIPSLGFPPQSYYQAFFPAYNPNINGNAATTIKYPYIFSLDANNGIIALQYSVPLIPFNILSLSTKNSQVLTWQTVIGHKYQLQSATAIAATNTAWSNVGSLYTAPSSGTQSYTNTSLTGPAKYYRVLAQ